MACVQRQWYLKHGKLNKNKKKIERKLKERELFKSQIVLKVYDRKRIRKVPRIIEISQLNVPKTK